MRDAKHECFCVEPGKIGPVIFPNAGPVFIVSNPYTIALRMYHTYKNEGTAVCGIRQAM
jgi:hypothetical protein